MSSQRRSIITIPAVVGTAGVIAATVVCGCGTCRAEMVAGLAEYEYTLLNDKMTDASGKTTTTRSSDLSQKYSIFLNTNPFPLMNVNAGGTFMKDDSSTTIAGKTNKGIDLSLLPYVDVTLAGGVYSATVGYTRHQSKSKTGDEWSPSEVADEYHLVLSWRPEGLPSTSLRASHSTRTDGVSQDVTSDMVSGSLSYMPVKQLNTHYNVQYDGSDDHIRDVQSTSVAQNLGASYSGEAWDRRVSYYASYSMNYRTMNTSAGGSGSIDSPLFAVAGLSAFTLPPYTSGAKEQNSDNAYLIDSNLGASAGINLGVLPPTADQLSHWSMGIDFYNDTVVNTLYVYVDRELPKVIANSFTWDVYVREKETDDWTLWQGGVTADFVTLQNQNHFEIRFKQTAPTRFVKVVVAPLRADVAATVPSFQNAGTISVTEMQAFINTPSKSVAGSSSQYAQMLGAQVRTQILRSPALYHLLSFNLVSSGASGAVAGGGNKTSLTYVVSNNLMFEKKINSYLQAGASAGRDDIVSDTAHTTAYLWSATLRATPLPGLANGLVYSGRLEQSAKGNVQTNSVYLTNTMQVYRGIAFNFSGGMSHSAMTHETDSSFQVSGGASIIPRSDLSFSLNYSFSESQRALDGEDTTTTFTRNGQFNVSYRPFPNLYLYSSLGISSSGTLPAIFTKTYGGTWSPFLEGNLGLTFSYNESVDNYGKTTIYGPSLTWKVMQRMSVDASYSVLSSSADAATTNTRVFGSHLRLSF